MKINFISVRGLFGIFNHPIILKRDFGITLILGENGLGKTVILKMLKAFLEGDLRELATYYFSEFSIEFEDGSVFKVEKTTTLEKKNEDETITFRLSQVQNGTETNSTTLRIFEDARHLRRPRRLSRQYYYGTDIEEYIERYIQVPITRFDKDLWHDRRRDEIMTTDALISKYRNLLPPDIIEIIKNQKVPEWFELLKEQVKIYLIETQRLLTRTDSEKNYDSTVVQFSKQLAEIIKNKRAEASDLASKLDRTFPNRLTNQLIGEGINYQKQITDSTIEEDFIQLEKKRELLSSVGLIDIEEGFIQPKSDINDPQKKELLKDVFSVYIHDSNEKLNIYDDLAKRIKLLIDIINKRFLYKKIRIDKIRGFVFQSTITKKDIPITGLSSGEQHELVLFYHLLFNTTPNSLILIDEPEISLHISWQKQFINDLRDIISLNDSQIIIATHSPDIIGKHWDLTVELKGIENETNFTESGL